ncbi:MAG: DUF5717 family protein [Gemmatales bacterium]
MVPLFCPRCQRANPPEALYCHFDGTGLRTGTDGKSVTNTTLGREFVFPSGRRCRTFDELITACSVEWSSARNMLQQGGLRQFLSSIGRMDLAQQADKAAAHIDPDLGLDQLLATLPSKEMVQPRLDLSPRRLHLGNIRAGESRDMQLQVMNRGARLLHGVVEVRGDGWLRIGSDGGGPANGKVPVKTGKQQDCPLHIETQGLPAGQQYAATLAVMTNGGTVEVPVTFDLASIPFSTGILSGCTTPKDLAARMKDAPKQVAPLLEKGEIERWYTLNGWKYPVTGPAAQGISAVQQFFEGLGLSKPPPLSITTQNISLQGKVGQTLSGEVKLETTAKKWIYAFVESDVPWLKTVQPSVSGGQSATVQFQVNTRGLPAESTQQGTLTLVGNGGQRLAVKVAVQLAAAPNVVQRFLQPVVAGWLTGLLVRLLCIAPDLAARYSSVMPQFSYTQKFMLLTFWIAILILWYLLRSTGKVRDFLAAGIVGSLGGMLGSATLAQLLPVLDTTLSPGTWPGSAIVSWTLLGAGVGLVVSLCGTRGRAMMSALSEGLGKLAGWFRLPPLARFLGA